MCSEVYLRSPETLPQTHLVRPQATALALAGLGALTQACGANRKHFLWRYVIANNRLFRVQYRLSLFILAITILRLVKQMLLLSWTSWTFLAQPAWTSPDISFAVSERSNLYLFERHMAAVKIQMSYLQGACELGLKYFRTETWTAVLAF